MKKLFAVLALVAVMTSCKDKKKDDKKMEETTTTSSTTEPSKTPPVDAPVEVTGVPKFSDPEVQKFANDYGAFMMQYKAGMSDPAKMTELSNKMQEWSKRSTEIGMKLASKPEEAQAWAMWISGLMKDMMPAVK
jgi:hypothetical protein